MPQKEKAAFGVFNEVFLVFFRLRYFGGREILQEFPVSFEKLGYFLGVIWFLEKNFGCTVTVAPYLIFGIQIDWLRNRVYSYPVFVLISLSVLFALLFVQSSLCHVFRLYLSRFKFSLSLCKQLHPTWSCLSLSHDCSSLQRTKLLDLWKWGDMVGRLRI